MCPWDSQFQNPKLNTAAGILIISGVNLLRPLTKWLTWWTQHIYDIFSKELKHKKISHTGCKSFAAKLTNLRRQAVCVTMLIQSCQYHLANFLEFGFHNRMRDSLYGETKHVCSHSNGLVPFHAMQCLRLENNSSVASYMSNCRVAVKIYISTHWCRATDADVCQ